MIEHDNPSNTTSSITEELKPLERLAEHLSARPMPTAVTVREVADWLGYSLRRCGLTVVADQPPPHTGLTDVERLKQAYHKAAEERTQALLEIERLRMELESVSNRSGVERPVVDFEKELSRLYNHKDDDSQQFTRWNMLVAIQHGYRLARTALDTNEGEGNG